MLYNSNLIKEFEDSFIQYLQQNIPLLEDNHRKNFIKEVPGKHHVDKRNISLFLVSAVNDPQNRKGKSSEKQHIGLSLYYMVTPLCKNPDIARQIYQGLQVLFHERKELEGDELKGILREAGNDKIAVISYKPEKEEFQRVWERTKDINHSLSLFYKAYPIYVPIVGSGYISQLREE